MRKNIITKAKRFVIKVGSSILTTESGYLSPTKVKILVESIATLSQVYKKEVILVSSGAIACGMHVLKLKQRPHDLATLQAAAAVGQGKLMHTYETMFMQHKYHTAQILLTSDGLRHRDRYLNARNTINSLLDMNVIPIVNENDTVATDEIKFGDNDNLAAQVALMTNADMLVILSDVDGFFITEGGKCRVLNTIEKIDTSLKQHLQEVKAGRTVGGMRSKLETGFMLMKLGLPFVIANGNRKKILEDIVKGLEVGTLFIPQSKRQVSKKRWLAFTATSEAAGNIVVDKGAYLALVERGKSLLASGVTAVKGEFKFGDAVRIINHNGKIFAKGIINFSRDEILKIKGKNSKDIKILLGDRSYEEVIHRDNMIILD